MAEAVYLSLGDREERVKNQAITRVGDLPACLLRPAQKKEEN